MMILFVVKLDIDTSSIKVLLVLQLLGVGDNIYSKLVDQFYYEHHVHMKELALSGAWKDYMYEWLGQIFSLHNFKAQGSRYSSSFLAIK